MKQLIVMSAMIMLGVFIYGLIAGDGEESLTNAIGKLWKSEISRMAVSH